MLGVAAMVLMLGTAVPASPPPPPHPAAIADPATDPAHPPRARQLLIPSGAEEMNALLYLAGGAGAKPLMILFHGLPGNEQNLDLAQAVRRAGWHVLTLHYRGSWGSPGRFSIAGAAEDAAAVLDHVRDPRVQVAHGIDGDRIVLAGHSMGGFAALSAAREQALTGLVLLDAWNPGADAAALTPESRAAYVAGFDDLGHALAGADAESLTAEVEAKGAGWDVTRWAPALAEMPVLAVDAAAGIAGMDRLVSALEAAGGEASLRVIASDHGFSDARVQLASAVIAWLDALGAPSEDEEVGSETEGQ